MNTGTHWTGRLRVLPSGNVVAELYDAGAEEWRTLVWASVGGDPIRHPWEFARSQVSLWARLRGDTLSITCGDP